MRLSEMRPGCMTPAHTTGKAAEMVCSNSFKSDDQASATGILKAELRRMDSLILRCAESTRVPAANSLAVDREAFSATVTQALQAHPNIQWVEEQVTAPTLLEPTILATGPLTTDPLADWLSALTGSGRLHFYDAIAPIVDRDSIDMDIAWMAARYDRGGADFINCPPSTSPNTSSSWTPSSPRSACHSCTQRPPTSRPVCPSRSWRTGAARPSGTAP